LRQWKPLSHARGSQGPRRPRFSFFRFTCQTARNPPPPLQTSQRACEAAPSTSADDKPPESEELRRRAIPPSGGAPCERHIGSTVGHCQPCILKFFMTSSYAAQTALSASPAARVRHRSQARCIALISGRSSPDPCRRTLATIIRRARAWGTPGKSFRLRDQRQKRKYPVPRGAVTPA
jgi:hypothetical protein